jgi:hypothetical protein
VFLEAKARTIKVGIRNTEEHIQRSLRNIPINSITLFNVYLANDDRSFLIRIQYPDTGLRLCIYVNSGPLGSMDGASLCFRTPELTGDKIYKTLKSHTRETSYSLFYRAHEQSILSEYKLSLYRQILCSVPNSNAIFSYNPYWREL